MIVWGVLLLTLLFVSPSWAVTQNCTVTWNARTEADLAGYKVLWGTSSGTYSNIVNVGNVTSTTCSALGITTVGTKYLVVRAFDNLNQESGNSTQVSFTLVDVTPPPTTPTITSFSPSSGVVGTTVTINGTNFAATLTDNTVKFNGTTASLSSGTTTQLRAVVPLGATTGKLSVTTSAGTGQSSADFVVSTLPPATTYDAFDDFSGTQGPVWSYLDQDDTALVYDAPTNQWNGGQAYQFISTYAPTSDVLMHPGASGGVTKLRFTSPSTATWNVSGTTSDADPTCGNGVIVTIVHNDTTTLASRTIANGGGTLAYAFSVSLTAGDIVEWIVDMNGDYGCDTTAVTAHLATTIVTPPPPPPPPVPPPPPPTIVIQSLTTPTPSFDLASSAVLTVRVSVAPTVNTAITILSGDQSIITTPSTVVIPAGAPNANFTVAGLAPGSTFVTASLNNSTASLLLTVLPTATLVGVELLAPPEHTVLESSVKSVTLRWQAIHAALRYELRVRDDTVSTDNTHPVCTGYRVCETGLIATSYRLLLKPGHSYTWSVVWIDQAGDVSASSSRHFAVKLNE